jgi:1-acyl-sn-glycerol-3-phosphate acyltransferase
MGPFSRSLRFLFFALFVRPVMYGAFGMNVQGLKNLPKSGPAIVVANHNSHLDTMALISLFPRRSLRQIRPVAAADYFLTNKAMGWFALNIVGILPINRQGRDSGQDPLAGCTAALMQNDILILFPEGTRGEPEQMSALKKGIAHLAERHPTVPVIPVFLHGLGKVLPRGHHIPLPLVANGCVGEPLPVAADRATFMAELETRLQALAVSCHRPDWD